MNRLKLLLVMAVLAALPLIAGNPAQAEGPKGYTEVSQITALPSFIPGLGTLYVKPDTLPVGPFLAYDKAGTLVSSIYMVPLDSMKNHEAFNNRAVGANSATQVDFYYNGGHSGVEKPHYHITVWHVDPASAQLK